MRSSTTPGAVASRDATRSSTSADEFRRGACRARLTSLANRRTEGAMGDVAGVARTDERSPMVVFGAAAGVGALVAVLAGVYGRVHDPSGEATMQSFFTSTLHF